MPEITGCGYLRHVGNSCTHGYGSATNPQQLEDDPVTRRLRPLKLGWQVGTQVPTRTGELTIFAFERWLKDGRHEPAQMALLNRLHPHFTRAGLIASRLGLERARTMVDTLATIGMPAAVVRPSRKEQPARQLIAAMLLPAGVEDIARMMRFCDEHGIVVISRNTVGDPDPGPIVRIHADALGRQRPMLRVIDCGG